MMRAMAIALALTAALANVDSALGQPKKYATPQAAFDAAKAAAAKQDMKGVVETLTDEAVDGMSGGMVFAGMMMKAFGKLDKSEKGMEMVAKIEKVLEKHGVTEDAMKNAPKVNLGKDPEGAAKAMRELGRIVKDRPAFIEDMYKAMDAGKKGTGGAFDPESKLNDVTVTGDTAKGTVNSNKGDQPITFKKIDGGWKIDLPTDFGKKKGGPGAGVFSPQPVEIVITADRL